MTHSLSIHMTDPQSPCQKVYLSCHLNRKPNFHFRSQNTGPLWVSKAIIKIDTNWRRCWQHSGRAGSAEGAPFIHSWGCVPAPSWMRKFRQTHAEPALVTDAQLRRRTTGLLIRLFLHTLFAVIASVPMASLPTPNWRVGIRRQWKLVSDQWSVHGRCLEAHGSTRSHVSCYDRSSGLWCQQSPQNRMRSPAQRSTAHLSDRNNRSQCERGNAHSTANCSIHILSTCS